MSNLQKSEQYDLIDMFYDTSRYLDDTFTIHNPELDKLIPDIYPTGLLLNKTNTSDKETSFLDLNIKVIGSDVHNSVYDKRDDFGFLIVNFTWLSCDVPRLSSSNYFQTTDTGYRYHKLRKKKTFGKFFRSYCDLLSKLCEISFQGYVSDGISHPVFYVNLVYKLMRFKCEANFVSSGSKIVKRLRRQKYDPVIIERTMGLVLGSSTALYRFLIDHCTLTMWWGLYDGTCPNLLRGNKALILVPSDC